MNPSPTSPVRPAAKQTGRWHLEIVRGRDIGRTFPLEAGETVVGNALNGQRGLDLVDQEGNSPRRMAARHAAFACSGHDLSIEDLESPGGTFVNQQRLLSGKPRNLADGDVIQLGGVQLRVKEDAPPAPAAPAPPAPIVTTPRPIEISSRSPEQRPAVPSANAAPRHSPSPDPPRPPSAAGGRLPAPFVMAGGAQCRSWDDFLIHSAQSWTQVREELTSGRLIDYLRRIGRPELVLHSPPDRSSDDRLDDWLAIIPATQASAPELDVHPQTLLIEAKTGGGVLRKSLRITNVGFRLLRSSVRIEPPETRWVRLLFGADGRQFQTIDQTDIPVEIELPETIDRVSRALIVIESNGGTRRVEVRIERPVDPVVENEAGSGLVVSEIPIIARELKRRLGLISPAVRAAASFAAAVGARLLVALAGALPIGTQAPNLAQPRIASVAIITIAVAALAGLWLAKRRGESRDILTAAFAGGLLGLLAAAPAFAALASGEAILGSWSNSLVAVILFWGIATAILALVSTVLVPHRRQDRQVNT